MSTIAKQIMGEADFRRGQEITVHVVESVHERGHVQAEAVYVNGKLFSDQGVDLLKEFAVALSQGYTESYIDYFVDRWPEKLEDVANQKEWGQPGERQLELGQ